MTYDLFAVISHTLSNNSGSKCECGVLSTLNFNQVLPLQRQTVNGTDVKIMNS